MNRARLLFWLYWAAAILLSVYIAAATAYRSERLDADAWEHHRAVRVLAELGTTPGNPTYATDAPSIRYSPYTVILAAASKATGVTAYYALSVAAVVSTILLCLALYCFLHAYRRAFIALPSLFVIVLLYGETPGYANSLALADLPWHQVNPSAAALAISLFGWTLWHWSLGDGRRLMIAFPAVVFSLAFATLTHGMTGVLGGIGLVAVALAEHRSVRIRMVIASFAAGAAAFAMCSMWPMYDFLTVMRSRPDNAYWYNGSVAQLMLTRWCLPCYVAALLALPYRRDPLVRWGLWGVAAVAGLTTYALVFKSATFARLPLAGLIFAQILVGYAAWRLGLLSAHGWRMAWRKLIYGNRQQAAVGFVALLLPAALVYFGIPQVISVLREPHLLRTPVAAALGREDKQSRYFERYEALLADVGERDVVMARELTAWPIPSFAGRVIAAYHLEYFSSDQFTRVDDVKRFFAAATPDSVRVDLLNKYNASWILVQRDLAATLIEPKAVAFEEARDDGLVLMRASDWIAARQRGK